MNIQLSVRLFGGFDAIYGGEPISALAGGRLQSLIAYLILHCGIAVPRQKLAGVFWPDSSEPQARTNLRQLFHNLRTVWPDSEVFFEADSRNLRWRAEGEWAADVIEFESSISAGDFATASNLYRGDLLPDLYEEWIEPHRTRLRQRYAAMLETWTAELAKRRQ